MIRFSRGVRDATVFPELQAADPAVLAVGVTHLVDDIHGVAAVGIERLLKAERFHHRLQRRRHLPAGQARLLRDLVHRRLPAQLLFQPLPRLHGFIGRIPQRPADPQGVVVPQKRRISPMIIGTP